MRRAAIAAVLLWSSVGLAHAQQDGNDDDQNIDCKNAETQADMNSCAAMDYEKADKQLNVVYKEALKSQADLDKQSAEINPDYVGAVQALKKAQRAWIDYRDGQCEGVGYQAVGGSMQPMLINGCEADLTNKRIKELQDLIKGAG